MIAAYGKAMLIMGIDVNRFRCATLVLIVLLLAGCASVPPQVAGLHQKEFEIITSLQNSHMAMVDAYVDQKVRSFESFFFKEYGSAYLKKWKDAFKAVYGRDYEENRDFNQLYSDLVAEYQSEAAPIEKIRTELRNAISREYSQALAAHEAVGGWINNVEKLNSSQREAMNRLLGTIKPGLSLDSVDKAVNDAKKKVQDLVEGTSGQNK